MKLLNTEHDILALAAKFQPGPKLPAPESIEAAVANLLDRGLLSVGDDDRIVITDAGREVLPAQPNRGEAAELEADGADH